MSKTAAVVTTVLPFRCAVSYSDEPPPTAPCDGECPEGPVCLDGLYLSGRVVDMAVPEADGEADARGQAQYEVDSESGMEPDAAVNLDAGGCLAGDSDTAPLWGLMLALLGLARRRRCHDR